ncbi:uncharacterized protein METZ01_LOCUS208050, partial [marine metagenome]
MNRGKPRHKYILCDRCNAITWARKDMVGASNSTNNA